MRAHRVFSRVATIALRAAGAHRGSAVAAAAAAVAAVTPVRHSSVDAAVLAQETLDTGLRTEASDSVPSPTPTDAVDAAAEEQRHSTLASRLLPYAYSIGVGNSSAEGRLLLPVDRAARRRISKILGVKTTEELLAALERGNSPETPEACAEYVNLVALYIRQQVRLEERAASSSVATRERIAQLHRGLRGLRLSDLENSTLVRKACTLVEERRVPIVVASRLLRLRWPNGFGGAYSGVQQSYVMSLVRSWATEALQQNQLTPAEAQAVLSNSAFALKSMVRRQSSEQQSGDSPGGLSSFIGALATTASRGVTGPSQAEGLIAIMWAVHLTGCPAPPAFWDEMVQRVVSMNEALGGELAAADGDGTPGKVSRAGHFFSTLTTRQLYRFLMVLKLVRWDGDTTVLHQLADQTLRNVAFELEAANFSQRGDAAAAGAGDEPRPSKITAFSATDNADARRVVSEVRAAAPPLPRSVVVERLQQVADLTPEEFLDLLNLAGELKVPFGVSAVRVADELLIPLVPHLSSKQLLLLLRIVLSTRSQSATLLQAVLDRIVERGPAAPYALPLAKTALKTVAQAPTVFQCVQTDAFVDFLCVVCEAQHTRLRAMEVAACSEPLYALSRRYTDTSPQMERLRYTINLLCAQLDRLLQLRVTSSSVSDRLLECTLLLRMRANPTRYPAVHELLATRAVATERERQRRETHQARILTNVAAPDATAEAATTEEAESLPSRDRVSRWAGLSEADMPQLSRAALSVYAEFAYMYERMVVVKAALTAKDFNLFANHMRRAGLYSLLHGALLFQQGHLDAVVAYSVPEAQAAAQELPQSMPMWFEKAVLETVLAKLTGSRVSSSDSDEEVLKVLGHVHCDAAKVDAVVEMLARSPLRRLQGQRLVWLYVAELARRFGSEETKKALERYLKKTLY
ncbi:mitochondrial RNA binding protein [Novymonas esmeraldas]|uniref:Mitochondrial RNA binding protein n=1 Tax=Novymonas esmeraldas TaxID=1808958 RepID=A0AAW0EP08_9TRYP